MRLPRSSGHVAQNKKKRASFPKPAMGRDDGFLALSRSPCHWGAPFEKASMLPSRAAPCRCIRQPQPRPSQLAGSVLQLRSRAAWRAGRLRDDARSSGLPAGEMENSWVLSEQKLRFSRADTATRPCQRGTSKKVPPHRQRLGAGCPATHLARNQRGLQCLAPGPKASAWNDPIPSRVVSGEDPALCCESALIPMN